MTTMKKPFPIDLDREILLSVDSYATSSSSSSDSDLSSPETELSAFQFSSEASVSSSANALPDLLFLGQRTPIHSRTPNNSPSSLDRSIASLVTISDDATMTTDSCASGTTLSETSISWAGMRGEGGESCNHTHSRDYQSGRKVSPEGMPPMGDSELELGHCTATQLLPTLAPSVPHCGTSFKPLVPTSLAGAGRNASATTAIQQSPSIAAATSARRDITAPLPSKDSHSTAVSAARSRPSASDIESRCCARESLKRHGQNSTDPEEELGFRHRMCNKEKKESGGGARPSASTLMPNGQSACSQACAETYNRLAKDLGETKDKLFSLALQVEEQASHIAKLAEENRRYILENGLMKKKNSRGARMNDVPSYDNMYNDRMYPDHGDNAEMEDKIMALRLQNSELNVCLEREKRLRREAEARLERDVGYIKRLEDSVQTLRGTRVIMDPSTYRQVAEAYMAAKRTPTRRPHTHNGVPGGLVCDATLSNVSDSRQSFSHPALHHTSSCPSAKSTSAQTSHPSYASIEYPEVTSGLAKTKRDRVGPHQDRTRGFGVGTNTMNPWDYQQLLESLEDLDGGSSRGALS